jgi:hypothetical protein
MGNVYTLNFKPAITRQYFKISQIISKTRVKKKFKSINNPQETEIQCQKLESKTSGNEHCN